MHTYSLNFYQGPVFLETYRTGLPGGQLFSPAFFFKNEE